MSAPDPFAGIIGDRRPLGIGITPAVFRQDAWGLPTILELAKFSRNPRNAHGDWYEKKVEAMLAPICQRNHWTMRRRVNLGRSKIYRTQKVVDLLINDQLGLELKYLKGTGSLVQPKSIVDALDFTSRPFYCIYVIDGPGWLRDNNVDYLARWWDFTCAAHLEKTVARYFGMPVRA